VYLFLEYVGKFGGRSLYIHTGLILGSIMAANVWMVIWPYQKKIITATKEGTPPDAALVAQAGLRSRHNTFMSVPLVFIHDDQQPLSDHVRPAVPRYLPPRRLRHRLRLRALDVWQEREGGRLLIVAGGR
jgi:hypothetical protein